jgi:serine/threonine-protein kinase
MRADIERALAGRPVDAVAAGATTQHMAAVAAPAATVTAPPLMTRDDEEPLPERRRTGAYVLLALAVLAVFVLAAFAGSALFGNRTKRVEVPDVKGLTVTAARLQLEQRGLKLGEQTPRVNETVPAGSVLEQTPPNGTRIPEGSTVSLVVATAPERTIVPPLLGRDIAEAQRALEQAGLKLGKTTRRAGPGDLNQVIGASAREGSSQPRGAAIDLIVASGSNKVPDTKGQSEGEARTTLGTAGFKVRTEQRESSATPGTVVEQTPAAGTSLAVDSEVTIYVAKAPPPPPTPTPTPTPTPPGTPTTTAPPTDTGPPTAPPPGG